MLAATWLSALATAVLALFAVVTAWYAREAFQKQSKEVLLLQEQADVQQKESERQAEERRRAQAVRVYVAATLVHENAAVSATVCNTSGQPIYDVRVHWLDAGSGVQTGAEDKLWTIGPDQERQIERHVPNNVEPSDFTVVAYFRDSAALRSTLTTAGHLAPVEPSLQPGAPLIATTALARSPYSTKPRASEAQAVPHPAGTVD